MASPKSLRDIAGMPMRWILESTTTLLPTIAATSHHATYTLARFSVYGSVGSGRDVGVDGKRDLWLLPLTKGQGARAAFRLLQAVESPGIPTVPYSLKEASCTQ